MHLLFPNLTWLISSSVLDTRCSTCFSLLFKSPNLQNSPLLPKHIPSNGRSLKTSDHPLEFKPQPLSQISSVAAGTTFYRFSHKRLKNFLQTTDSEMQTLCWISRPYSPFRLFPPSLRRLRAISPSCCAEVTKPPPVASYSSARPGGPRPGHPATRTGICNRISTRERELMWQLSVGWFPGQTGR